MKQSLLQKGKGAADAADEDPEMLPDTMNKAKKRKLFKMKRWRMIANSLVAVPELWRRMLLPKFRLALG